MSDSGFASLGPSLLARKGGAKPAMRPQVAPLVADESEIREEHLEDLGWNDMGHDTGDDSDGDTGADIVPIHADIDADAFASGPGPIVRRQQRRLEERVLADAVMTGPEDYDPEYDEYEEGEEDSYEAASLLGDEEYGEEEDYEPGSGIVSPLAPVAAVPAPALRVTATKAKTRVPAVQSGRRAAFTLRLDADRHLKLRLAATMQGVSAQVLVTEALDRLLAEYDDLDVIANHLKRH
jgi:hypothetical protein